MDDKNGNRKFEGVVVSVYPGEGVTVFVPKLNEPVLLVRKDLPRKRSPKVEPGIWLEFSPDPKNREITFCPPMGVPRNAFIGTIGMMRKTYFILKLHPLIAGAIDLTEGLEVIAHSNNWTPRLALAIREKLVRKDRLMYFTPAEFEGKIVAADVHCVVDPLEVRCAAARKATSFHELAEKEGLIVVDDRKSYSECVGYRLSVQSPCTGKIHKVNVVGMTDIHELLAFVTEQIK